VTDAAGAGKYASVQGAASTGAVTRTVTLDELYRDELEFVWRTVRYLGISDAEAEDVVHEIFIVVGRRLVDFDGAHSMRSWLAGIARRVVLHQHRSRFRAERKHAALSAPADDDGELLDAALMRREAATMLEEFLAGLDDDKRSVFVLAELEGMSAPEIAHAVEANVNTVYSRLRIAREAFEKHVARRRSIARREGG
jgi:RNA polymerase sigma-70 factor, ECF subfamily